MIRSTRKILNVLLRDQLVSYEKLNTFMIVVHKYIFVLRAHPVRGESHNQRNTTGEVAAVEIESILNSRPLVPISTDPTREEPLTPSHLLLLRNSPNVSPGIFAQDDNYARKRWRHVQYLTDQFWVRWIHTYLPTLQERSK